MTKRLIYFVVLLVWALLMCFPFLAFAVAMRGHVEFGSAVRIFLIQEDNQGVGVQWNRRVADQKNCVKSSVRFFFWEGKEDSEGVDFCRCYEDGDINGSVIGPCLAQ